MSPVTIRLSHPCPGPPCGHLTLWIEIKTQFFLGRQEVLGGKIGKANEVLTTEFWIPCAFLNTHLVKTFSFLIVPRLLLIKVDFYFEELRLLKHCLFETSVCDTSAGLDTDPSFHAFHPEKKPQREATWLSKEQERRPRASPETPGPLLSGRTRDAWSLLSSASAPQPPTAGWGTALAGWKLQQSVPGNQNVHG